MTDFCSREIRTCVTRGSGYATSSYFNEAYDE
jgi:hypothetical protein